MELLLTFLAFGIFITSLYLIIPGHALHLRGHHALPTRDPGAGNVPTVAQPAPPVQASPLSRPLLRAHPPILCPLCHTPTALEEVACPGCGLVFRSRVPAALQALERYTALRPLGDGGMSSVYLAHDRYEDRLCVIKTLLSVDEPLDPDWRIAAADCLRREATLLGQVDHPRIAHLLDWVSDERGDFLVLAYVAGPTLEQRLTRRGPNGTIISGWPLPPEEALAYAASVAATLTYLTQLPQPLLHLDIKPANLILPPNRRHPVLVDFGGAVRWRQQSTTFRIRRCGTPGYAAPEQYQGYASPKSDVYGLGATLYHLLTDDAPSSHPLSCPALATLPPDIAAVLTPALAHDPALRPNAATFRGDLFSLALKYAHPYVTG